MNTELKKIVEKINQHRKKKLLDRIKTELQNEELFEILKIKHSKRVHNFFETLDRPRLFVNKKGELVE